MDPLFTVLGDTFPNNANKTSPTALYTCKIVIHSLIHTFPTNNKKQAVSRETTSPDQEK